ncbi:glycosyltransferase [Rhodopseudomonas palustris]|uniref:glycosyltransferase n=1 Tax=Rhodopseudomonas palustris TaxID=1076 RepID=UPI001F3E4ECA|nr:glycosyltransferase [Rhodopseudomonas palustris]
MTRTSHQPIIERRSWKTERELGMSGQAGLVDCDFTLALNNRTGKFFFCGDLIAGSKDLIRNVYYWRLGFDQIPTGLIARILGRLAVVEIDLRVRHPRTLPTFLSRRDRVPIVFTDPREVLIHDLRETDIILCHDVGPLTHPTFYADGVEQIYRAAFDRIAEAKPHLLFASESSCEEFKLLYGDDFPYLGVLYPPIRFGAGSSDQQPVTSIPGKFFLSVGSLGTRKNQLRAIEAFGRSGLVEKGYRYVICGGPEPGAEHVIAAADQTPGVLIPGYVNDPQLRWLYSHAEGFILPSLLEGFGLPAAEAIHYGVIPLLSRGGALEEVAGPSAILVDPLDVDAIVQGMHQIAVMSEGEKTQRLDQMRTSIARFSTEDALGVWRSVLSRAASLHQHVGAGRSTSR